MNLPRLLIVHAVITFAAGVVLIVAPGAIPQSVDISLAPQAYLLCYFLGAAEISLAFLSYGATRLKEQKAIRLLVFTFILFHAATAAVEVYAIMQGGSEKLWANVALRIVIVFLFWYYGIRAAPALKTRLPR